MTGNFAMEKSALYHYRFFIFKRVLAVFWFVFFCICVKIDYSTLVYPKAMRKVELEYITGSREFQRT